VLLWRKKKATETNQLGTFEEMKLSLPRIS